MKKFKRFVAITLIFVMTLSLIACSSPTTEEPKQPEEPAEETPAPEVDEAEGKEGKVLNIWGWNDEFQGLFNNYFAGKGLVRARFLEDHFISDHCHLYFTDLFDLHKNMSYEIRPNTILSQL